MTHEEAIKQLEFIAINLQGELSNKRVIKTLEAIDKAQEALTLVSKHPDAYEKQIPKGLIVEGADEAGVEYEFNHYMCPNCKDILHQHYKQSREPMRYRQKYCHECGQALKWQE